jgi:hypothetical protein
VLRVLLGVRRDYNPQIIHQDILSATLVKMGYDKEHVGRALEKTGYDVTKAAQVLVIFSFLLSCWVFGFKSL